MKPLEAELQAILFVHPDPLPLQEIYQLFSDHCTSDILEALESLHTQLQGSGLHLRRVGQSYQMTTALSTSSRVENFLQGKQAKSLTPAQLEVLAIVAYQQPVTRRDIEELRGVNSDRLLQVLLDWELIAPSSNPSPNSRAKQYETTNLFLAHFGLESLKQLPEPEIQSPQTAPSSLKTAVYAGLEDDAKEVPDQPSQGFQRLLDKIAKQRQEATENPC